MFCNATYPYLHEKIQILSFGPINMYTISGTRLDGRPPSSYISPHCHSTASQLAAKDFKCQVFFYITIVMYLMKVTKSMKTSKNQVTRLHFCPKRF